MRVFDFYYKGIEVLAGESVIQLIERNIVPLTGIVIDYSKIVNDEYFDKAWMLYVKKRLKIWIYHSKDVELPKYIEWLRAHNMMFDSVMEEDEHYADELVANGFSVIPIISEDDDIENSEYCAVKGFSGDIDKLQRIASKCNKVHLVDYLKPDLFDYGDYINSADSNTWTMAGSFHRIFKSTKKSLTITENITDVLAKQIAGSKVADVIGHDKMLTQFAVKDYRYANYYNLWQVQRWVDAMSKKPKYEIMLAEMAENGEPIPAWAMEKDVKGNPKTRYIAARFNNFRNGLSAKAIQQYALQCNTCAVRDKCPAFQKDSLCFFMADWKKFGKTRNKDQYLRLMENIVADKVARWQQARIFEQLDGGKIDKNVTTLEADLIKALEVLGRLKYGLGYGAGINMLNAPGSNVSVRVSLDDVLEDVRKEYGPELVKKIEREIKEADEDDGQSQ